MKKSFYTLFLLFLPFLSFSQLTEDFNDSNFTSNPAWIGDTALWQVAGGQLNSNSTVLNSTFYISTPATTGPDMEWRIYVNFKQATSGANYMDIYLVSDSSDLLSNGNGFFVRIGGTPDEISLFRKDAGTEVKIIDGTDGRSQVNSTDNKINLKVTRSATNDWNLTDDNSGTGTNYFSEGTINDPLYPAGSYFGMAVTQSSASFFNKHFFDDIYAGPIVNDTVPPVISNIIVISTSEADVYFDEPVDSATSSAILNYSADNSIGNPATAIKDNTNPALVHLTFSTLFTNGLLNTLTVTNVKDLNNNAIVSTSGQFTYIAAVTATYKDVIINEIFSDPTPQVGLPAVEFLELHNRSNKIFDLGGWTISIGSSTVLLPVHTFNPGDFVILCKTTDTSLFTSFGPVAGLASFPTLVNSGAHIELVDNNATVLDSVDYTDNWYNDAVKKDGGWTLELINPSPLAGCSDSSNWTASVNPAGGTPGQQNSVYSTAADTSAPVIISAQATDSIHVTVCFSEGIQQALIGVNTNYAISGSIGNPFSVSGLPGLMCAELTLAGPMTNGTTYTLTVFNLADCAGNLISTTTINFIFIIPSIPSPKDVIITEIYADPATSGIPEAEFVEIFNQTNKTFDLGNWSLTDGSTNGILPSYFMAPGEYVILCSSDNESVFAPFGHTLALSSMPTLNNSGDDLSISDPNLQLIDEVAYSDSWYHDENKDDGGWTLELINPLLPAGCDGASNWRASVDPAGGTPGEKNSVYSVAPDLTLPAFSSAEANDPLHVVVCFTESMLSSELTNTANYIIVPSIGVLVSAIAMPANNCVELTFSNAITSGTVYELKTLNMADCSGNMLSPDSISFIWYEAFPAAPGDVVINEILFNPLTSGFDFVEIYNKSAKVIDMRSIHISNGDILTGVPLNTVPATTSRNILFPDNYAVFTEDTADIKKTYLDPVDTTGTIHENLYPISDLPTFDDDEGIVIISDTAGNVLDSFHYYDAYQFALLNSHDGVSLERLSANRPSSEETNWHSAAQAVFFGTPTYKNSENIETEQGTSFFIYPEVFSPDLDGTDDMLSITYHFDTPGLVANITIYDARGRIVRKLKKNELLGNDGTFSWDGINEDDEKAAIGIYIIYIETFGLNGDVKKYKKTCVLGGKL